MFDPNADAPFEFFEDGIFNYNMYLSWGRKHFGYGQFSARFEPELNKFYCYDEMIGKENIRKLLHDLADYIADNCATERDEDREEMDKYHQLLSDRRDAKLTEILEEGTPHV